MNVATILLFVLACYGLTFMLVFANIFDRIRPKHHFFHCALCVGFHVGWIVALMFWWAGLVKLTIPLTFILCCVSSGTSYALSMLVQDGGWRSEK